MCKRPQAWMGMITLYAIISLTAVLCFGQAQICNDNNECDDQNPCTEDICDFGTCVNNPTPGVGCSAGGDGICLLDICNDQGQCGVNADAGETCPDNNIDDCYEAACDGNGTCDQQYSPSAYGSSCFFTPTTAVDECLQEICDGSGTCGVPVLSGTPCTDFDGNDCTEAACDGSGYCQQDYFLANNGTPCTETDGNQCTTAACDAGFCNQEYEVVTCSAIDCNSGQCDPGTGQCMPQPNGTPCRTAASECDAEEVCDGLSLDCPPDAPQPDGTACSDNDATLCTIPGCEGGVCVQDHLNVICIVDECNTGCDPTTGMCTPEADGTPCADKDANVCTVAACEMGDFDSSDPARPFAVAICNQTYAPAAVGTSCADTDGDSCTFAGCVGFGCEQEYQVVQCPADECNTGQCDSQTGLCIPEPNGTPCADTDNNVCTVAACELLSDGDAPISPRPPSLDVAYCNQTYAATPLATPCGDTDGEVCTAAACDGCGECLQDFRNLCPEGGCRVTGGGVVTNTFPAIRYATHGGQVGASLSGATGFDPNSACIKGQWTHVRHVGPGDLEEFHGRTYDSLMCACLGCDGIDPIQGGICNPGDLQCGPGHPEAPGNAICVSGVGDFAEVDEDLQPRTVLFRIDVEDRGEPGKGVDKYRIRIWKITELEGNPDDPASDAFRMRQGVACQAAWGVPEGEAPYDGDLPCGVRPPDIDDGNYLITGNQQLHKPTHAKCEPSSCVGQTCGTYSFDCNPNNPDCSCLSTAEGTGACATGVLCAGLAPCTTSADCASGEVCAINTCCGAGGVCHPVSCPDVATAPAAAPTGGLTSTGR